MGLANHPFRADKFGSSTSASSKALIGSPTSPPKSGELGMDGESRSLIKYVKVFGAVVLVIGVIWLGIYGAQTRRQARDARASSTMYDGDVPYDFDFRQEETPTWSPRHRSVQVVKESESFLSRIFCRGFRRSSFCDN